jgi:formate/nitrite transporter FocA (FNT family)
MIEAILAGMMIALGATVYLTLGTPLGPFMFAVGLLAVLTFEFNLFTGKAGKLATKEIKPFDLFLIWLGNFVGTELVTFLVIWSPNAESLHLKARDIIMVRMDNTFLTNVMMGILCGILMYLAVTMWKSERHPIYAILPVAVFIFSGYNHCVADMFYTFIGLGDIADFWHLVPTTLGNLIGCNLIPYLLTKKRVE